MTDTWICPACRRPFRLRGRRSPPIRHRCAWTQGDLPLQADAFVTTRQLVDDAMALASGLPSPARVIGIARSGMIPASVIATLLGAELWSIDQHSLQLEQLGTGTRMQGVVVAGETILIDDSVWSGNAMRRCLAAVRDRFGPDVLALAVYGPRQVPDVGVRVHKRYANHWFEWNLANAPFVDRLAWDLDGVLCRDFTVDEDDDGDRYLATMRSMSPTVHRPRKPITIVTARLERYRQETLSWLERQGIPVARLIMGPWATKREREAADVWGWKAVQCRDLGVSMFIESSSVGASVIAARANVVCVSIEDGRTWLPPHGRAIDRLAECLHRGEVLETRICQSCGARGKPIEVHACAIHGRAYATEIGHLPLIASCRICCLAGDGFELPS